MLRTGYLFIFLVLFAYFKMIALSQTILPVFGTEEVLIESIQEIGEQVWLGTNRGAFRWKNGKARVVEVTKARNIVLIREIDNVVWLGTDKGAYRWENGKVHAIVGIEEHVVHSIQKIKDVVWFSTSNGPYRWENGKAQKSNLSDKEIEVYSIQEIQGEVWFGASNGAYRWTDGDVRIIEGTEKLKIYSIDYFDGTTWLSTASGAYQLESGMARILEGTEERQINSIQEIGGVIWLGTNRGAYWFENEKVHMVKGIENDILYSIHEIDGGVWFKTNSGVCQWEKGSDRILEGPKMTVESIQDINGKIYLGTATGAYKWENQKAKPVSGTDAKSVGVIEEIEGVLWIGTPKGAFMIVDDVSILFVPNNIFRSGSFSPRFEYTGLTYKVDDPKLRGIITPDKNQFLSDKDDSVPFNYVERLESKLKPGYNTLFWCVKDKWGNTYEGVKEIWAYPKEILLPIYLLGSWLIVFSVIFCLSPFILPCYQILINSNIRGLISLFGLFFTIAIMIPIYRRYLLIRYSRAIREDENFSRWQSHVFFLKEEFHPNNFGDKLEKHRAILLLDQSGNGNIPYLQFLSFKYAAGEIDKPRNGIPVFISLDMNKLVEPKIMFSRQLKKYGRLNDPNLNNNLLEQGGFLIFLDGLNKIEDPAKRQAVREFIDHNSKLNYFVVSSEENFIEFNLQKMSIVNPSE